MSKFQKRHTKVGARPGTLVIPEDASATRIRVMQFDTSRVDEYAVDDCAGLAGRLNRDDTFWVDVQGLGTESMLRGLAEQFGIHPLALEDVVNIPQRPKIESHEDHLLLVTRMVRLLAATHLDMEQLAIFIGENYVITFQERPGDVLDPIRKRLRDGRGPMRRLGAGYLGYAILDAVIDAYYPVLEQIGDFLESLEEEVVARPTQASMQQTYRAKRELLTLRRCIWPQREMLNSLIHDESSFISPEVQVYLRDTYDHCVQVIDGTETYRELVGGLMDLYLSSVGIRQNEVMKVLTVMASIFIPLTFLAGIYGMNFQNMPELQSRWGYPILLGLMVITAAGMLIWFRRRGWLGGSSRGGADPVETDSDYGDA